MKPFSAKPALKPSMAVSNIGEPEMTPTRIFWVSGVLFALQPTTKKMRQRYTNRLCKLRIIFFIAPHVALCYPNNQITEFYNSLILKSVEILAKATSQYVPCKKDT